MNQENKREVCGSCDHFDIRDCSGRIASEIEPYQLQISPTSFITIYPLKPGEGFCRVECGGPLGTRNPDSSCGFRPSRFEPVVVFQLGS